MNQAKYGSDAWKNPKQRELKVIRKAVVEAGYEVDAWKNPKQRELKEQSEKETVNQTIMMHGKIPNKGN